jgi:hypothetical protein
MTLPEVAMPQVLVEKMVEKIAGMERADLIRLLSDLQCDFKMDFNDDFLNSVTLERLKHIVLAASLHAHNSEAKFV